MTNKSEKNNYPPIKDNFHIINKNVISKISIMDRLGDVPKHIMTVTEARSRANQIIRKYRCNSVLDLIQENIPLDVWREVESLLIEGVWPPISQVRIQRSTITEYEINPKVKPLIYPKQ